MAGEGEGMFRSSFPGSIVMYLHATSLVVAVCMSNEALWGFDDPQRMGALRLPI